MYPKGLVPPRWPRYLQRDGAQPFISSSSKVRRITCPTNSHLGPSLCLWTIPYEFQASFRERSSLRHAGSVVLHSTPSKLDAASSEIGLWYNKRSLSWYEASTQSSELNAKFDRSHVFTASLRRSSCRSDGTNFRAGLRTFKRLQSTPVRAKFYPQHQDNDRAILSFWDIDDGSHITLTLVLSMLEGILDAKRVTFHLLLK